MTVPAWCAMYNARLMTLDTGMFGPSVDNTHPSNWSQQEDHEADDCRAVFRMSNPPQRRRQLIGFTYSQMLRVRRSRKRSGSSRPALHRLPTSPSAQPRRQHASWRTRRGGLLRDRENNHRRDDKDVG